MSWLPFQRNSELQVDLNYNTQLVPANEHGLRVLQMSRVMLTIDYSESNNRVKKIKL